MKTVRKLAPGLLILIATPALASQDGAAVSLSDWTWLPSIVIPMLFMAALYCIGIVKMRRALRNAQSTRSIIYFGLALGSLVSALDSPLHELGEQLFWVHMTQHEILMLISAPLLLLSRPMVPFLWALPRPWRQSLVKVCHATPIIAGWRALSAPLSSWLVSAIGLWVWHMPLLFDQTLRSDWIHALQHITFLGTAMLFWWPIIEQHISYGIGLMYVFTTALHTSVLGAMLTFSPHPWYGAYVATAPLWHLTAVEDQQLGGLIMWIPAGVLLLVVGLYLLVKWMQESQTRCEYTKMADLVRLSGGSIR